MELRRPSLGPHGGYLQEQVKAVLGNHKLTDTTRHKSSIPEWLEELVDRLNKILDAYLSRNPGEDACNKAMEETYKMILASGRVSTDQFEWYKGTYMEGERLIRCRT